MKNLTFDEAFDDVAEKLQFMATARAYFAFYRNERVAKAEFQKATGLSKSHFSKIINGDIDKVSAWIFNSVYFYLRRYLNFDQLRLDMNSLDFQKTIVKESNMLIMSRSSWKAFSRHNCSNWFLELFADYSPDLSDERPVPFTRESRDTDRIRGTFLHGGVMSRRKSETGALTRLRFLRGVSIDITRRGYDRYVTCSVMNHRQERVFCHHLTISCRGGKNCPVFRQPRFTWISHLKLPGTRRRKARTGPTGTFPCIFWCSSLVCCFSS